MKIRFDFVTNSSSSSFIAFTIENEVLADICREYHLPVSVCGDEVSNGYIAWQTEDAAVKHVGGPKGDSIAKWFLDVINPNKNNFMNVNLSRYNKKARDIIKECEDDINRATKYARIDDATVCTDTEGSGISIEIREDGKIKNYYVYHDDYFPGPLFEVIEGCTGYDDVIIPFAEKNGLMKERPDPWIKIDDGTKKKSPINLSKVDVAKYKSNKKAFDNSKNFLGRYKDIIDNPDFISLTKKNVVFSGWHPVESVVREMNVTVKKSVSAQTDYLFVDLPSSTYVEIEKVREMREQGKGNAKIITTEKLLALLEAGKYE